MPTFEVVKVAAVQATPVILDVVLAGSSPHLDNGRVPE
jgi:hypothetical protein